MPATRPRRPSTVHSTSTREPSGSCDGGTDASAIACLRIGLQPTLVARPTWRPPTRTGRGDRSTTGEIAGGRPWALNRPSMSYQSSSQADEPPTRAAVALLALEREPADEIGLVEADEPPEADLARAVVLVRVHRVAGRRVVDLQEDESRLEPDDVEGEHPGRPDPVVAAGVHERFPERDRVLRRDPELVAEIARVAGPRDVDRHLLAAGLERRGAAPEVAQVAERCRRSPPRARPATGDPGWRARRSPRTRRRPSRRGRPSSGGASGAGGPRRSSGTCRRRGDGPSRRRSPCRARRTTACSRPGPASASSRRG